MRGDVVAGRLVARGDTANALAIWEATLEELREDAWGNGGDALVGRYLDVLVVSGRGGEDRAGVAFDLLLRPTSDGGRGGGSYRRLLAQVASVVPDSVRTASFVGPSSALRVTEEGSDRLVGWWVSQDPFPATAPNERVQEHLLRVGVALSDFPDPAATVGYDDRGDLFVRYGAPTRRQSLRFDDSRLVFGMSRAAVGVSRSSFLENEVWTYPAIDETMTYILVKRGDQYRQGRVADLLPPSLRTVIGQGQRQIELNEVALLAMQYVYSRLATSSMEYGNALGDVEAALERTALPLSNVQSAVLNIQRRVSLREGEREALRAVRAPASVSRVRADAAPVPYVSEAVRYRSPDGTTWLSLAWHLTPSEGADAPLLLVGSVVTDPLTADRQTTQVLSQEVSADQATGVEYLAPVVGDADCLPQRCGPNVQLDLFLRTDDGGVGERVGTSVWQVRAGGPLRTEGLEMSDIRTIDPIRNEPVVEPSIVAGTPISVYFEAYGFKGGANASRVKIDYEVVRRRRGALLRRSRETPTSGQLRLVLRGTTTEQFVILDTSDWADADEVDVRIQVRDERTGETVERARTFVVSPEA